MNEPTPRTDALAASVTDRAVIFDAMRDLERELARLRRICNAAPVSEHWPEITIEQAMEDV
jgi:hypothetical protein